MEDVGGPIYPQATYLEVRRAIITVRLGRIDSEPSKHCGVVGLWGSLMRLTVLTENEAARHILCDE